MSLLHETLERVQHELSAHERERFSPQLLARVQAAGFQPLGVGSHRLVVALPDDRVAKLALREIGQRDNEVEWHVYRNMDEPLRTWLCEPLELTAGRVLIQRRCLPISLSHTEPLVQEVVRLLARAGIADVAVNLGVVDQKLVCYDYAQVSAELLARAADSAH